jgi:hypothetical protein
MSKRDRTPAKRGYIGGPISEKYLRYQQEQLSPDTLGNNCIAGEKDEASQAAQQPLAIEEPAGLDIRGSLISPFIAYGRTYAFTALAVVILNGIIWWLSVPVSHFTPISYSPFSNDIVDHILIPMIIALGSLVNCFVTFSGAKDSKMTDIYRKSCGLLFGVSLSVVSGVAHWSLYLLDSGAFEPGDKFIKELNYQDAVLAPERKSLENLQELLDRQSSSNFTRDGPFVLARVPGLTITTAHAVTEAGPLNDIIFYWEGYRWERPYFPENPLEYRVSGFDQAYGPEYFNDSFRKDYLVLMVRERIAEFTPQRRLSVGAFMYSTLMRSLAVDTGYYETRSILAKGLDAGTRMIWLLYIGVVVSAVTGRQSSGEGTAGKA